MGKPVIMGRKTYDSIGKPLPGRVNIVVTRSPGFSAPGVFAARKLHDAIRLGMGAARMEGAEEVCIIGGGEIYAQSLDLADRIYLSRIDAEIEGDTHFPSLDSGDWAENRDSACEKNERNQFACEFFHP